MSFENRFSAYRDFTKEETFDFSKKSSIGLGGKAEICFCPQSLTELSALLGMLERDNIEYYVLGNLTNVLPSDAGTRKAIVCLKNLKEMIFCERWFAYSGVQASAFVNACKKARLSGAEFLCGIPCTIGGALFMNAGAGDKYIDSIVDSVLVYRHGGLTLYSQKDCQYAYNSSVFMQDGSVIIGAHFALNQASLDEIEKREEYYRKRRKHLPKGRSMGCVFKNPQGRSAGELIEKSGLKGLRIGGAFVSEEHANFIINGGDATASDVKKLIHLIKNAVYAQYGVYLEEEIQYLT